MIKEKAVLISTAPWLLICCAYIFFGPDNHPFGDMVFFIPALFGYFYGVTLLAQRYRHFANSIFGVGGVLLAFLYALLAWRSGFEFITVLAMVILALFSYSLFLYLVKKTGRTM